MSPKVRLLLLAGIYAAAFVFFVVVAGLDVGLALFITAVTFAITSMLNGWPRMPRRRV